MHNASVHLPSASGDLNADADVQIKCTRKCTSRLQYNGFASARSNPQGIVFLKANLNLN
jgi:hypothetical protein